MNILDSQLYLVMRMVEENLQLRQQVEKLDEQIKNLLSRDPEKAEA